MPSRRSGGDPTTMPIRHAPTEAPFPGRSPQGSTHTGSPAPGTPRLAVWAARAFVALVAVLAAATLPTASSAPIAALGIVAALVAGRWQRRCPWKWLPDVLLVCLPYWVALSFLLGPHLPPAWVLGCAGAALVLVLALPPARRPGMGGGPAGKRSSPGPTYAWMRVLRRQAPGLSQAVPVALVSLVLFGLFLVWADRGFDRTALMRFLGHLGLFFAGVPLALTAVYGAGSFGGPDGLPVPPGMGVPCPQSGRPGGISGVASAEPAGPAGPVEPSGPAMSGKAADVVGGTGPAESPGAPRKPTRKKASIATSSSP